MRDGEKRRSVAKKNLHSEALPGHRLNSCYSLNEESHGGKTYLRHSKTVPYPHMAKKRNSNKIYPNSRHIQIN